MINMGGMLFLDAHAAAQLAIGFDTGWLLADRGDQFTRMAQILSTAKHN